MSLFTGNYRWPLGDTPDPLMQAALDAVSQVQVATGAPNASRVALMVVELGSSDEDGRHRWAGLRQREVHYSASLLKVAAMYAAFDLRSSAEQLREENGLTTWSDLESAFSAEWTPELDIRIPDRIRSAPTLPVPDRTRSPRYAEMLQVTTDAAGASSVGFTPSILNALEDMVPHAHNGGAMTIIRGLGYPFINAKLADDGFFEAGTSGIWLAGDYSGAAPYVRIPSVNDGDVAQATTAWHLAALLTLMADRRLIGPDSSEAMLGLLARAGNWFGHTSPPVWPNGIFSVTGSKVGVGPLKTGQSVFSEGLFAHDNARGLDFAVVWQNAIGTSLADGLQERGFVQSVAQLVEAAALAFVPSP